MTNETEFTFQDVKPLYDGNLCLILENKCLGNIERGLLPFYEFKIVLRHSQEKIGYLHLRIGNTDDIVMYSGHIGYGIDEPHRGNGYSARACILVLPLARSHGLKELWITCDPDNIASRRICARIGAEYIDTVPLAKHTDMYKAGKRFSCRYRLVL